MGMLIVMAYLWKKPKEDDKICINNIFFLFGCLTVIFTIYGMKAGQIGRLADYFQLFMCIGIVNSIKNTSIVQHKKLMMFACDCISILAIIITYPNIATQIDNFKFFWQ